MYIKTLLILVIFFSTVDLAAPIDRTKKSKNPLYDTILSLQPDIEKDYAMKLSNIIYKYTKKYELDPYLLIAIMNQESKFDIAAQNCRNGLSKTGQRAITCTDFSILQISYSNIKKRKINLYKLMHNMEYAVENGCIILKEFKESHSDIEKTDWWTRYNSSNRYYRKLYHELVCRYYKGTKFCKPEPKKVPKKRRM